MTILAIARSTPFHRVGGLEIQSWAVLDGLAHLGHKVIVVTSQLPKENALPAGLRCEIKVLRSLRAGEYSLLWYFNVLVYWCTYKGPRPDVIFSVSTAGGVLALVPKRLRRPILMQLHGTAWGEFLSKTRTRGVLPKLKSVRNLVWLARDMLFYRAASICVMIGATVAAQAARSPTRVLLYRKPFVRIDNGIDTELFSPVGVVGTGRVLVLSRLIPEKGTELAVEIFIRARKLAPSLQLVVIGGGPSRSRMETLLAAAENGNAAEFLGELGRVEVARQTRLCSVLLFPTLREEGLPTNMLEALASGLPVVTTTYVLPGLASDEVVKRFEPSDIDRMAIQTAEFAMRPTPRRNQLSLEHSLSYCVSRYEELLAELIAGRSGGGNNEKSRGDLR